MSTESNTDDSSSSKKVLYPTSKFAIASLVLGVLAIWPFRIFTAIPAIICGHLALREIKSSQGAMSGLGYARFGLVVGYLCIVLLIVSAITAAILLPQLREQVQDTLQQLQSGQASH